MNLYLAGYGTLNNRRKLKIMKLLVHQQIVFCTKVSKHYTLTLREKCPYSELFWSVFSCILPEYGEIQSISPDLVRMQENTGQNNSKYRHFFSVWDISSRLQHQKSKYSGLLFLNSGFQKPTMCKSNFEFSFTLTH